MNYSGIIFEDTANGIGIRTSLFVSGCRNHCKGCFNQETWDFDYGKELTDEDIEKILDSVDDQYHAGISILGGEPMEPENAKAVLDIVQRFNDRFNKLHTKYDLVNVKKNVWLYTGYTLEYLQNLDKDDPRYILLNSIHILVDGKFDEGKKDISLKFRGSSNQKIYRRERISLHGNPWIDITETL